MLAQTVCVWVHSSPALQTARWLQQFTRQWLPQVPRIAMPNGPPARRAGSTTRTQGIPLKDGRRRVETSKSVKEVRVGHQAAGLCMVSEFFVGSSLTILNRLFQTIGRASLSIIKDFEVSVALRSILRKNLRHPRHHKLKKIQRNKLRKPQRKELRLGSHGRRPRKTGCLS